MITNNPSAPTTPMCGRRLGAVVVANARSDMGGSGRGADPFTRVPGKAIGERASPHRRRTRRYSFYLLLHWQPALRAAGVEYRGVYACRHTFAAWSIAAGVQPFHLSRIMGTSVSQIDATYGHLVPDSEEYLRGLLDSYDRVDRSEAATNL
jgi:integrase